MLRERIKRTYRRLREMGSGIPAIPWVEAADNRWGVPVLDVRPVTLNWLAVTTEQQYAENFLFCSNDDGTTFVFQQPRVNRRVQTDLRYPIDRVLADGVLFSPQEMEHKWAIFYHRETIFFVRSWLREVQVVASVEVRQDHVEVTAIRGTFTGEDEDPQLTVQVLDYLLRSHALDLVYPAPLPPGMEKRPRRAAMWCMSMFGNMAYFATPHQIPWSDPDEPLRTDSRLHIAVARGDVAAIEASLAAGLPIDLLAGDGLAPLHRALARDDTAIMAFLLERGSPVDVRCSQGATALMSAVESGETDKASFLIDHGAAVNACDSRGFTALHRAAEMGHLKATKMLLERGASPYLVAEGHTARSFAEGREESDIVALISEYDGSTG